MENGTTYLDQELVEELSIPADYIEKEKAYQIHNTISSLHQVQMTL